MIDFGHEPILVHLGGRRVYITIGYDVLAYCAEKIPKYQDQPFEVTDKQKFAEEICRILNEEQEDGTTLLTNLFDDAIVMAVEDGCEGIEY